jgi:hypothetical protein
VITLPGRIPRQFSSLLRRCSHARSRDAPPFVLVRQDQSGLSISATRGDVSLRWQATSKHDPAAFAFTADHLDAFGNGRSDVTLAAVSPKYAEARWDDDGTSREHRIPVVEPDRLTAFPKASGRSASLPPSFLSAMTEAVRSIAKDSGRFALTRVLLRGNAGALVATDGKQLLLQGGYPFPWSEDVLVPAVPAFAAKELVTEESITIGRSGDQVLIAIGTWTFALKGDKSGRFPRFEDVLPRGDPVAWCAFERAEVSALVDAIAQLPGHDDADAPVTLDLSGSVVIRAMDGAKVEEVSARRGFATGHARTAFNRLYLARALRLGLTHVEIHDAGKPVVARDESRTFVWAALGVDAVVPPRTETDSTNPNLKETPMPSPTPNGHSPPVKPADESAPDLLTEAEAVRDAIHHALDKASGLIASLKRQKKQTRALKQAVQSLRQLQPFDT